MIFLSCFFFLLFSIIQISKQIWRISVRANQFPKFFFPFSYVNSHRVEKLRTHFIVISCIKFDWSIYFKEATTKKRRSYYEQMWSDAIKSTRQKGERKMARANMERNIEGERKKRNSNKTSRYVQNKIYIENGI